MARKKTTKTRTALTYETLPALFTGICDALRVQTGGSDLINHQDIPSVIAGISGDSLDLTTITTPTTFTANPATTNTITASKTGLLIIVSLYGNSSRNPVASAVTINSENATFGSKGFQAPLSVNVAIGLTFVAVTEGDTVVVTYPSGMSVSEIYIEYA